MKLKAQWKAGRHEVTLLPLDPGDWLDEDDRVALHQALKDSDEDIKARRLVDAEVILVELRGAHRERVPET